MSNCASLLSILTDQIVCGRITVEEARDIVKRREYYRAKRQLREALGDGKELTTLEEIKDAAYRRAISEANGDISAAAAILGVGRTTIYRRLRT